MSTIIANCPCGGHTVALPPDKPPVGGRAAFTCPACGIRRTFMRTRGGVVFDAPGPAAPRPARPAKASPAALDLPAADAPAAAAAAVELPPEGPAVATAPEPAAQPRPEPAPSLVPPGLKVALAAVADAGWRAGLAEALPETRWFVLEAVDPARTVVDFRAHGPRLALVDNGPAGTALAAEIAALPGRAREGLVLLAVGETAEADPLAAFAASADAVLDVRCAEGIAERIRAAMDRAARLPSLFTAP